MPNGDYRMHVGRAAVPVDGPPRYTEQASRRERHCEAGCGIPIAKGDRYRISLRNKQELCIPCWTRKWPTP